MLSLINSQVYLTKRRKKSCSLSIFALICGRIHILIRSENTLIPILTFTKEVLHNPPWPVSRILGGPHGFLWRCQLVRIKMDVMAGLYLFIYLLAYCLFILGAPAGQDYSAQWAEYYRSIGKMKEAEAIEAQMRAKVGGQPGYPGGAPAAAPYPGAQPGFQAQPQPGYYPPQQVRQHWV